MGRFTVKTSYDHTVYVKQTLIFSEYFYSSEIQHGILFGLILVQGDFLGVNL